MHVLCSANDSGKTFRSFGKFTSFISKTKQDQRNQLGLIIVMIFDSGALLPLKLIRAAKTPANEPLTGLFIGSLTAQFYLLFLTEPQTIFKIPLNFRDK